MTEKKVRKTKRKDPVITPEETTFIEEVSSEIEVEEKPYCVGPSFTLKRISQGIFHDIYGRPEIIADRMGWVNEEVYHIVEGLGESEYCGRVIITDIYRKPTESYLARKQKGNMVAPCGLSGHNYGLSIDIDVQATAKSFGMNPQNMRKEMQVLGFHPISKEAWHYNMVFSNEGDYFYGLYKKCSPEFLNHVKEVLLNKFNKVCGMQFKNVGTVQAFIGLVADSVFGPKTFLATTMLMAEKMGMIDVLTKETDELIVDFGKVWE